MDGVANIVLQLALVLALVGVNGFFVAAEFALVKIRETQLRPLLDRGHRRARLTRHILSHLDPYLSACQLGITLASLALGWVGEPAFVGMLEPVFNALAIGSDRVRHITAVVVGFTLITFLHIVVGEQAPKFLAIKRPLPSSLWSAYPLHGFFRLTYPFIWVLNIASLRVLRWMGVEGGDSHGGAHSEEELRLMLAGRERHGAETAVGRDLVLNAFDLRRRVVREVMTPHTEIAVLDTTAPMSECLRLAEQTRYSRFPLAEDGNPDRTVGVVHFKDLVAMRGRAARGGDLQAVCRPLIYVPPTARLERVLQLFLDRKLHLAIVVDEYGGTLGLVTLENILEELVGQIQDEFDHEKPRLVAVGEREWELDGLLPLHELEELLGVELDAEDVSTVSGWLTRQLGGFPQRGDRVPAGAFEITVTEVDDLRVTRASLRPAGAGEPDAGGGDAGGDGSPPVTTR